ncbi:MAG: UDP-galactopyranose mutase [Acholeplasmataceae bacterium]|jgi:UDP-galactopyranose mutase
MYDYIVVGAGFFGAVFAYEANRRGKKVLVLEKRDHIGGNAYTKNIEGIEVHYYGAHIFHTKDEVIWEYINQFTKFNHYVNSPIARYKDEVYNLPFNMNTFSKLFNVFTPQEALAVINKERSVYKDIEPKNLEEQALKLVGKTIYQKLIKGYTEKQWGTKATNLPSFIIRRLPLRFKYDNNYFNDPHQGIPINGYTEIFEKLLDGIEVRLNTNFLDHKEEYLKQAKKVIYTGMIDEYYDYKFGKLRYRSLSFDHRLLDVDNFQGNAVINYTEYEVPYTRVIEHKHFYFQTEGKTVVTYEYPKTYVEGDDPYYSVNDEENMKLYNKYKEHAEKDNQVIFGGRLGLYQYYDMDQVIKKALELVNQEFPK